ncbi:hypothetical protein THOM_0176, partial [Trachipleistophora hominis]
VFIVILEQGSLMNISKAKEELKKKKERYGELEMPETGTIINYLNECECPEMIRIPKSFVDNEKEDYKIMGSRR